ncbi:MAG: hypothetical protein WC197_07845 [Candidatus Gastranaerophilaceae bacterium]|jgi:hypothetical protein
MRKKIAISLAILSIYSFINLKTFAAENASSKNNPVFSSKNTLGVKYAENKVNEAEKLIKENKLQESQKLLIPLLIWLEDGTKYHANLYQTLKDIDTARMQADVEKDLALKFAIIRDLAKYHMGIINIKENNKTKAVDNFVDIVKSQPKTDLGFKAYEQLINLGFTYKIKIQEAQPEIK